jgi:hypothetical protein
LVGEDPRVLSILELRHPRHDDALVGALMARRRSVRQPLDHPVKLPNPFIRSGEHQAGNRAHDVAGKQGRASTPKEYLAAKQLTDPFMRRKTNNVQVGRDSVNAEVKSSVRHNEVLSSVAGAASARVGVGG